MVAPTRELHGYGARAWLRKVAKHEAGHALMLWLLDQYLAGIYICENGGVTMRVAFPDRKMTHPSQHLLYTIAGMVMTYDHDVQRLQTALHGRKPDRATLSQNCQQSPSASLKSPFVPKTSPPCVKR